MKIEATDVPPNIQASPCGKAAVFLFPVVVDGETKLISRSLTPVELAAISRQAAHVMHGIIRYGVKTAEVSEVVVTETPPSASIE